VLTKLILSLSDYESWIKADVDKHRASAVAGLTYPHMWYTLIQGLESWVQYDLQISRTLYRHHTKAHVDEAGDWAQNLNQFYDHLVYMAKVQLPAVVLREGNPPRNWHCPPSTVLLSPWEVGQYLTGPLTVGEWEHAISTRRSTAKDTDGLYHGLYRVTGPTLRDTALEEFNTALFYGRVPIYRADGTSLSTHRAIAKSSGGNRHLGAPDTALGIFSSIISTRLIQASTHVSQHIHMGVRQGKYSEGKVCLFFLNDLSKAFDKAQHPVILRALQTVMGEACTTRFLALLDHMHYSVRVVVTQDGLSIIVDKEAGVIQGGPEALWRLIPPEQRPKVQFLTSVGHWEMRIELDYADDEQRVANSVEDMQICITGVLRALHTVNLEWNASKLGVLALRVNSDQSVTCFDPHLTVPGPDGSTIGIRAIEDFETFTLCH
jgi:hypothetical protein